MILRKIVDNKKCWECGYRTDVLYKLSNTTIEWMCSSCFANYLYELATDGYIKIQEE